MTTVDPPSPAPPTSPIVPPDQGPTSDEKTMGMLCHLLGIFTSFIGPLIIWLIKKDESAYVDTHGRHVLNFTLSIFIYQMGLTVLLIVSMFIGAATGGIGFILTCALYPAILGLGIFALVIAIMRCIDASKGITNPYPLSLPLLKVHDSAA